MKRGALVASLVLVALAVRVYGGLDTYPPFCSSDEASAAIEARALVQLDDPRSWFVPWMPGGGLTRLTLVPLRAAQVVFGDNIAGTRMAHVVFGVVSVWAFFAFARRFVGDRTAWIAAALLALSHVHIHFSRTHGTWGIQTAAAMALVLWAAIRVRDARTSCAWLAWCVVTGLILGWGVQTYQQAFLFPVLLPATLWSWRRELLRPWWHTVFVIFVAAAPVCAQWAWWYITDPTAWEHIRSQSLLDLNVFHAHITGQSWASFAWRHTWQSLVFWWYGQDGLEESYGAAMAALDPVTGVLFAGGLLLALWRWRSPVSVFTALWLPALFTAGVLTSIYPPSYHRMTAPLLCVCLLAAQFLVVVTDWLPRVLANVLVAATVGAVAVLNLHFYFVQFPRQIATSGGTQKFVRAKQLCADGADWRLIDVAEDDYLQRLVRVQCGGE